MTGREPRRSASSPDFSCSSYRNSYQSLLCRRRTWNAVANHVDAFAPLQGLLVSFVFDHVDIADAAQRQRQRAGLARTGERLRLFGSQLERYRLSNDGVLAVFLLWRLIDGENAYVWQNDFRLDDIGCIGAP